VDGLNQPPYLLLIGILKPVAALFNPWLNDKEISCIESGYAG